MRQQLKIDLHERTLERMKRLISDTFDLYEMAELEPCDAVAALAEVLGSTTAKILSTTENSAEMLGAIITVMVRRERGEISAEDLRKFLHRLQA